MRHVASLVDDKIPPRDDEFKFRARAKGLVDKWHQILNANKAANGSPTASGPGQTNGKPSSPAAAATEKKDEEDVTNGTEKLDLNGNSEYNCFCNPHLSSLFWILTLQTLLPRLS